jgi:hypothetical protein
MIGKLLNSATESALAGRSPGLLGAQRFKGAKAGGAARGHLTGKERNTQMPGFWDGLTQPRRQLWLLPPNRTCRFVFT